jgi:hypothetical protein
MQLSNPFHCENFLWAQSSMLPKSNNPRSNIFLIILSIVIADKAFPKFIPPLVRGHWKGLNTFGNILFSKDDLKRWVFSMNQKMS